jgi:hypothetical protein
MTTAADIVRRGFREDNLIPIGRAPTLAEQTEGLELLNSFIKSVYGYELGEFMEDWVAPQPQRTAPVAANFPQLPYPLGSDAMVNPSPFADDYSLNIYPYPPSNSRIVWDGNAVTLYVPEQPRPGARIAVVQGSGARTNPAPGQLLTLNGNGRLIETAVGVVAPSVVLTQPISPMSWFYRADIGVWKLIAPLTFTDEVPFPEDYDDFWICALSMRLAPRYTKQVSANTTAALTRLLGRMKAEFRQVSNTVYKAEEIPRGLESYASGRWMW